LPENDYVIFQSLDLEVEHKMREKELAIKRRIATTTPQELMNTSTEDIYAKLKEWQIELPRKDNEWSRDSLLALIIAHIEDIKEELGLQS